MIFIILSVLYVHLFTDKNKYLVGENIFVGLTIINKGKGAELMEKFTLVEKLYSEDAVMRNSFNKRVHHSIVSGTIAVEKGKKYNPPVVQVEPGETITYEPIPIVGLPLVSYGGYEFVKDGKIGERCIPPGEYYFSISLRSFTHGITKIISDTVHFIIKEPQNADKEAWEIYKRYVLYLDLRKEIGKALKEGLKILMLKPPSNYRRNVIYSLKGVFSLNSWVVQPSEKKLVRKILACLMSQYDSFNDFDKKGVVMCLIRGFRKIGMHQNEIYKKLQENQIPFP